MTQDGDFLGGLHYDGTKRDVEVGPMTGIVRYYPVPPAPPARTPWWRYTLVFVIGLVIGGAAGVALCTLYLWLSPALRPFGTELSTGVDCSVHMLWIAVDKPV